MSAIIPIESGLFQYEDEVFTADRDGNLLVDISDSIDPDSIRPDWDIDRPGSKGQLSISARDGVLESGMRLAVFRTLYAESGEVVRYPRGRFRIGAPGISYSGAVEVDTGLDPQYQDARGSDIIDEIAQAGLTGAFYTPVGGHVMSDVLYLIKMATMGIIGANQVSNSGFEIVNESGFPTGWISGGSAVGVGSHTTVTSGAVAEGERSGLWLFNTNRTAGEWLRLRQVVPIPAGTRFLLFHGVAYMGAGNHRCQFVYEWMDGDQSPISDEIAIDRGQRYFQWTRHYDVVGVPDNASYVNLHIRVLMTANQVTASSSRWDDIQVRAVTSMPLPDHRINLPPSTAVATSRIQTAHDKQIGYDAINADRLAAIGHHALLADMDDVITTMPLRTLNNATPKRVYGAGDMRILDEPVEIPDRNLNDAYNHFRASKESMDEDVPPLFVNSYNQNPADPNSVQRVGRLVSAPIISVPDAVDEAALQAVADAARDRQSIRESVVFAIVPDAELTVYDIIEITDPSMPRAMGKWAINNISDQRDSMVITATRAIGGG